MENIKVEKFYPTKGKIFYKHIQKDFCYATMYGQCSLELTEYEVYNISEKEVKNGDFISTCGVEHCRDIYKKHMGKLILLTHFTCGHYSIDDGNHRCCIANKKSLSLNAHVTEQDSKCSFCTGENEIKSAINQQTSVISNTSMLKKIFKRKWYLEQKNKLNQEQLRLEKVYDNREKHTTILTANELYTL